jgi:tetratricopeptide (TPR) repeat protein
MIEAAAAYTGTASLGARASVLLGRALLHGRTRADRYAADLERALAFYRELDDQAGIAMCVAALGLWAMWRGDRATALASAEEAVRRAQRSGDGFALAYALAHRVMATDYTPGAPLARDTVQQLRAMGDDLGVAVTCNVTGYSALATGRYDEAVEWLQDGLDAARASGMIRSIALLSNNLGLAKLFSGDLQTAAGLLSESLRLCRPAGTEHLVNETLLAAAALRWCSGDPPGAARLLGAARAGPDLPTVTDEDDVWDRLESEFIGPARSACDRATWDRAVRAGHEMTLDEAIEFATGSHTVTRDHPRRR